MSLWRISDLVDFETACQGWYDFYTPGFQTIGSGRFSQCMDRSTFGRHIVQPVFSRQPSVGTVNGFNMADGNRGQMRAMQYIDGADIYSWGAYTIVRLMRHENTSGNNRSEYGFRMNDHPTTNRRAYVERDGTTAAMRLDGSPGNATTPSGYVGTSWNLRSERFPLPPSVDQFEFRKNTLPTIVLNPNMGFDSIPDPYPMNQFVLFGRPDDDASGTDNESDMQLLGQAMFNRVLTPDEIAKVEGMFAWDTGFESLLPAGHPYELAPPMAGITVSVPSGVLQLVGSQPKITVTGGGIPPNRTSRLAKIPAWLRVEMSKMTEVQAFLGVTQAADPESAALANIHLEDPGKVYEGNHIMIQTESLGNAVLGDNLSAFGYLLQVECKYRPQDHANTENDFVEIFNFESIADRIWELRDSPDRIAEIEDPPEVVRAHRAEDTGAEERQMIQNIFVSIIGYDNRYPEPTP